MDIQKKGKKTTGRKKIEIKKLDKNTNKQVTFSKRRAGLFKKASELCILCNVEAAIIVFSPADKLFCFGQPNVETILARYLKRNSEIEPESRGRSVPYEEYNRQYEDKVKKLDLEKKTLAEAETLAKVWNRRDWWDEPVDEMSIDQLEQFMVSIFELRRRLEERACELMMMLSMI